MPQPHEALFPGLGSTTSPMSRQAADKALRQTCSRIGLEGVSLHSFRRTAAQDAVDRGLPLHVVQALTGHKSLGWLGEYLAPSESQVLAAIGAWRRGEPDSEAGVQRISRTSPSRAQALRACTPYTGVQAIAQPSRGGLNCKESEGSQALELDL